MASEDIATGLVDVGMPALAGMLVRGSGYLERLVVSRRGRWGRHELPDIADRATALLAADWARSLWIERGAGLVAFNELDDGIVTVTAYDKLPHLDPLWCSTQEPGLTWLDSLAEAALLAAKSAKRFRGSHVDD